MPPSEPTFWATVDALCERDPRYHREAYAFVLRALGATVQELPRERQDDPVRRHLTGGELVEGAITLARREFGLMAPTVFREWGLATGEDVGRIVFQLVETAFLSARPEDRMDDFLGHPDLVRRVSEPEPGARRLR